MERRLCKLDVIELQAKIIEKVKFIGRRYLIPFHELRVLVVIEVDEEVRQFVQQSQVLVRIVVFIALPFSFAPNNAKQTKTIQAPLAYALAFLQHACVLKDPCELS